MLASTTLNGFAGAFVAAKAGVTARSERKVSAIRFMAADCTYDVVMSLSLDARLLFTTRILRLFAYGFLAVVLVLYLSAIGLDDHRIGLLLSLTLAGDVAMSLYLTTRADAFGRKRTLLAGALLMLAAAIVFAMTRDFTLLVLAATIGVISPSGNEVGPFLAIEQVAIAQAAHGRDRTSLFAWYNLAGSFATAAGSLVAGFLSGTMMRRGFGAVTSYRIRGVRRAARDRVRAALVRDRAGGGRGSRGEAGAHALSR
jgi:MFS family permease